MFSFSASWPLCHPISYFSTVSNATQLLACHHLLCQHKLNLHYLARNLHGLRTISYKVKCKHETIHSGYQKILVIFTAVTGCSAELSHYSKIYHFKYF